MVFYQSRLFPINTICRYSGVVHEAIVPTSTINLHEDIHFVYSPSFVGSEKTNKRWYRDLGILMEEYERTGSPRECFYLGQTYECLNNIKNAIEYYGKRSQLGGYHEETYMAFFRLGRCYDHVILGDKKDWNKDTIKENKASHDGAEILLGSMGKPEYLENAEKAVKNIGIFKKN